MKKIKGVHHIALKPNKEIFAKTLNFYRDTMGFDEVRSWGDDDNKCYMLSCGDNTVMEVLHGDDDGTEKAGAFNHVAFATDAVDELIEEIKKLGYKVTIEPNSLNITPSYPVRIAFFIGPVGETIELFSEL